MFGLENKIPNKYEVLNIYLYGSKVYGCNPTGDNDYIVVVEGQNIEEQLISNDDDFTLYSKDVFQQKIDSHDISILECIFLPKDKILQEKHKFSFELNLENLRKEASSKSSNSFVKCKKKLMSNEERDIYIGKKSLFHSLRIIMFAIQIAKFQKIIDYAEANDYWEEIVYNEINDWDFYKKKYQPILNSLTTEFRKLAPKRTS
ncbi:hypothetical protein D3C87_77620 [compost metagenome]